MPPGETALKSRSARRPRLGRAEWIDAAKSALIDGGIASVRVERLADALGVTTGSFYWHFKDRSDLLDVLLDDWVQTNSRGIIEAVQEHDSAEAQFDAVVLVWVNEDGFSSAYDSAVRDWARQSKTVEDVVREVDHLRIALLKTIFLNLGYDEDRAEVRARIMYFHQVGYYAMDVRDDDAARLKYRPLYIEALRDGPGRP